MKKEQQQKYLEKIKKAVAMLERSVERSHNRHLEDYEIAIEKGQIERLKSDIKKCLELI